MTQIARDSAFEMAGSAVRFGPGITREVGMDLADLGVRRALVFTDGHLAKLPPVAVVLESLTDSKLQFELFDRVRVEPTYESFQDAIAVASAEILTHLLRLAGDPRSIRRKPQAFIPRTLSMIFSST